jgi:hypothetical protein
MIKQLILVCCLLMLVAASKRMGNSPYVQSAMHGVFYVKSVPTENEGTAGVTKVYRVRNEADELVDTYDWYAPQHRQPGVTLGWSPIAGKIAVMRVHNERADLKDDRLELSFYLGGKLLKAYTAKDLIAMGAGPDKETSKHDLRESLNFTVTGYQQKPSTNDYFFVLTLPEDKPVRFDILTGEVVR